MKKRRTHFKPAVVTRQKVLFTEENTLPIAQQFDFDLDYPLADRLDETADWYLGWAQAEREGCTGKPTGREAATFLREGSEHAKALADWLDRLGLARGHLLDVCPSLDLDVIRNHVRLLKGLAGQAARRVTLARRTPDANFHRLLQKLIRIYWEGTGRRDRITWSPVESVSSGPLLDFVQACFERMGIKMPPLTIGRALRRELEVMPK